jgi:hypothetical protein
MEDFFFIPNHNINNDWNPLDKDLDFFVLDYCDEALNIPLFLIEEARCADEGIELELKNIKPWMTKEDWYVNLFRISDTLRVS